MHKRLKSDFTHYRKLDKQIQIHWAIIGVINFETKYYIKSGANQQLCVPFQVLFFQFVHCKIKISNLI